MLELFPSRTIALSLFGWPVHWYGILYLCAFAAAYHLSLALQKHRELDLPRERWSSLLTAAVIGVIAGGRLGYVFFYEPLYFRDNPAEAFMLWQGGMSSHGGFIGVLIALAWSLRHYPSSRLKIADVIAVPIAVALAIGRLGNFINQELYGTQTTLPWGIAIPGVEGLRHPTQLYAVATNLIIAGLCFFYLRKQPSVTGRTMALFLILYGMFRFTLEFWRVPTHTPVDVIGFTLTRGQALTIPLVITGVMLWILSKKAYLRRTQNPF